MPLVSGRSLLSVTLAAAATRTSSGTGDSVDLGIRSSVRLYLDVSAAAGSLAVTIQHSRDGSAWGTLGTFTATSAAGVVRKSFPNALRYVRASWALSGTNPSVTFGVSGDAAIVYCTPAEFARIAMPAAAIAGITDEEIDDASRTASDEADDYLNRQYTFPLSSWPDSMRRHVASIMALVLMRRRGYAPEAGARDVIKDGYEEAKAWLKKTAEDGAPGIVDATPLVDDSVFAVACDTQRGW